MYIFFVERINISEKMARNARMKKEIEQLERKRNILKPKRCKNLKIMFSCYEYCCHFLVTWVCTQLTWIFMWRNILGFLWWFLAKVLIKFLLVFCVWRLFVGKNIKEGVEGSYIHFPTYLTSSLEKVWGNNIQIEYWIDLQMFFF